MVAERKGVDRLAEKSQHARPLSFHRRGGHAGIHTKRISVFRISLSKPAGNVGQQIISENDLVNLLRGEVASWK